MTYTKSIDPLEIVDFDQMANELPASKWSTTALFEATTIAIDAGIDPNEFHRLPEDTRATYIAHARAKSVIQEYERLQAEKKNKPSGTGARTRRV